MKYKDCRIAVTFSVPKWVYIILKDISLQNSKNDFSIYSETRELTLSALMKDFGVISDDGEWAEINDYLKEVE